MLIAAAVNVGKRCSTLESRDVVSSKNKLE